LAGVAESWVAIDFETASVRGTPCAVGLVEVEEGVPTERAGWLIRPPLFEFSPFNVALHGITPERCRNAPSWEESLERIEAIRRGRPLLAHNASFDIGVIRDACGIAGIPWPSLTYACTLVIGRRVWPSLSSYSLPFLAGHLGILSDSHHDPQADAEMAALVGCLALERTKTANLNELLDSLDALMGFVSAAEWSGCHLRELGYSVPRSPSPDAHPNESDALFGLNIAFTGALSIPRREAMQAVVDRGAVATRGVTRKTDILVTGFQDLTRLAAGESKSAKLRKAEELRATGRPIEIITEADLIRLLQE
jgi:DNA polymerase III epsilon subunit-like protein